MKHVDYLALGIRLIVVWSLVVNGMQSLTLLASVIFFEVRKKFVEDLAYTYNEYFLEPVVTTVLSLLMYVVLSIIVLRYADRIASFIVGFAKPRRSETLQSD